MALGCEKRQAPLGKDDGWYVRVEGVKQHCQEQMPELCAITIDSPTHGQIGYLWHWECEWGIPELSIPPGMTRLIMPRCFALHIAVGHVLVNVFGGAVQYSDHGKQGYDYIVGRPRWTNCPSDGALWQELQQAIYDVQALAADDIAQYEQYAAYH
jgi:hypothetical protein